MIFDKRSAIISFLRRAHSNLDSRKGIVFSGVLASSLLVGLIDFLTGIEFSFSLFYLGPVSVAAWYLGALAGYGIALLSAALWMIADLEGGHLYSQQWIPVWNSVIRLAIFVTMAGLIVRLKDALKQAERVANTDHLTRLSNRRAFRERLEMELNRAVRYPEDFTLVLFDLDDFKQVNDSMGHDAGDELLERVGTVLRNSIRGVDVAARLGGDEFAVLFPQMGPEAAETLLPKLRGALLAAMRERNWPVTFSIGAISFVRPSSTLAGVLKAVDELMYQVKEHGKNDLWHRVWVDSGPNKDTGRSGIRG